jgi:CRP-like cAMP-binding protein
MREAVNSTTAAPSAISRFARFSSISPTDLDDAAAASGRATTAGIAVDLTLTQADVAARLGTARELVARAFSQLERTGVIARRRTRILISGQE